MLINVEFFLIAMNRKSQVIIFLWVINLGMFPIMATFDLIGDSAINWSSYLLMGTSVVTMIFSVGISFFTYTCRICGKLVNINDNNCKRCGRSLVRSSSNPIKEVQTEPSLELPGILETPPEPQPMPYSETN